MEIGYNERQCLGSTVLFSVQKEVKPVFISPTRGSDRRASGAVVVRCGPTEGKCMMCKLIYDKDVATQRQPQRLASDQPHKKHGRPPCRNLRGPARG